MMRLSLCNEVLAPLPLAEQCRMAAELGYAGLEIAPFTLGEDPLALSGAERRTVRRTVEAAGLVVTGLHWLLVAPKGLSLTDPSETVRRRTQSAMQQLTGLCAELGGRYLVHGSPAQRKLPEDKPATARAWAMEAFAAAADAAKRNGVVYCLEPLSRHETNFVNTVAEAAEIVREIGNPNFRTMVDCSAAGLTESVSVPTLLQKWLPSGLIAHVQVNDPNRKAPGQGEMDFAPILKALKAGGYQGDIAVEPFIYQPDGPGAAKFAIDYLRRMMPQ
ncbi:sugar phosphate isomerase/epimerase family protein [Ferrovibrio sp. MS7]|uniref:sugar phosphate isomerase/epimerase family protein n=1 Tax=Ferrovibrio plantarum TaxID=3119164 RepID=UPI00313491C7